MSESKTTPTTWRTWHGRDEQSDVRAMIASQLAKQDLPELIYRDPLNGSRRIKDFSGLCTPEGLRVAVPLTEARLFYSNGILHLVADGSATRWAVWCEGERQPAWSAELSGECCAPECSPTVRKEGPLVLRGNRSVPGDVHTGLSKADLGKERIRVFQYFEAGVLQWWRLTIDG